jgi:prephenate dehydrogenase
MNSSDFNQSTCLPFTRVAIIGVGLLGGSLALALKQHQLAHAIVGYGRNIANLREAQAAKLIDEIATDVVHAVTDADLIVLATPVGQFADLLTNIAPYLAPYAIVIDVGSTKADVAEHFTTYLNNHLPYCVPCHPIAGAEKSGWQHAQADLFMGRTTVICPLSKTLSVAQQRIMTMWQTIGSHCVTSNPQSHDYTYGMVSHLPHLLAFAMMNQIGQADHPEQLLNAAGTGFRDFTRIAASHPQMWCDISLANRHNLLNGINGFMSQLSQIQTMLQHEDADALHAWISHAAQLRRKLT